MNLLVGKYRRLQQISRNGFFKVIALDHRDVFVNMLATSGKKHEVEDVIEEKLNIIRLCNRNVSGYLVDTEYGLPKCLLDDAIGGDVGFMVSYEDNDYSIENFSEDYFVKDFTVEQVKSLGASVLKVFLYFDPNSKYADKQLRIIKQLAQDCKDQSMPLLLEPVLKHAETISPKEKVELTFKMMKQFKDIDVDIFKICFPGDIVNLSEEENLAICNKMSSLLPAPWVIMSFGSSIEHFSKELIVACKCGASGYVAGRALWKEFVYANGNREEETKKMQDSVDLLNAITEKYARPWKCVANKIDFQQNGWFEKI